MMLHIVRFCNARPLYGIVSARFVEVTIAMLYVRLTCVVG
jgi:hypothetical protein